MIYLDRVAHLFSAYFHQDWNLCGSDYKEVLNKFLEDFHDDIDVIIDTIEELSQLLANSPNELDLRREAEKYECEYWPYPQMSYKEWIASIHLILSDYILNTKINKN